MKNKNNLSQSKLIMEFFEKNPNRDIPHPEIVDWATDEYRKRTGNIFRDPDRQIRQLHQKGYLIKVKKGVYRYDPISVKQRNLEDFTPTLKKAIFERDNYRCVVCGRGPEDGVDIHVDHIKPKDFGGKATFENGQTLDGKALMFEAFNSSNPKIKLNIQVNQSNKDEQEGFMHIFAGVMQGIRNPKGHEIVNLKDPYRTLEYLSTLSLLFRKLDDAKS